MLYNELVLKSCDYCFIEFKIHPWKLKKNKYFFCSVPHFKLYRKDNPEKFPNPPAAFGKDNNRWNNYMTHDRYGYKMIFIPDYPKANSKGYYPEHRYVMEKYLGRLLERTELVHHVNHDKLDNRIGNLMIVTRSEHPKIHPPK